MTQNDKFKEVARLKMMIAFTAIKNKDTFTAEQAIFDVISAILEYVNVSLTQIDKASSKISSELEDYKNKIQIKIGPRGFTGEKGDKGDNSTVPGPRGQKGDKGDKGDEGKPGKDGIDGDNGIDGSPDTAEDIVKKLSSLKGNDRLDASAIKNLQTVTVANNVPRISLFGGQSGGGSKVKELTAGAGISITKSESGNYTITASGGVGTGDVVGPSSSTNNNIAVFDGVTGKIIADSGVAITAIPSALSDLTDDSTHRVVTDTEKSTWNGKQTAYTILSTLGALSDASGTLTNDGAGNLSWGAAGGGATTALDNLASVAINTSLISDTDSTDNLGSSTKYWANAYIDKIYLDSDSTIVNTDVDNWNTAYGWGDHSSAGYLTSISGLNISDLTNDSGYLTSISGLNISDLTNDSGYLTSLSGAVLTSQATPQTIGDTTNRLTKLWAVDITVTNAITGSVTGNAGTVTGLSVTTGKTLTVQDNVTISGALGTGAYATIANYALLAGPTFTGTVTLPKTTEIQDTSADHQYVLAVSELTSDRTITLPLLTGNDTFVFQDHTQTLTNKRISPRVVTTTDDATAEIDVDVTDQYQLTAIANNTTFTTTGTPVNGQRLIIRLKDAGATKTLSWNAVFRAVGITLPTSTTASKTHYVGCVYNSADSKWDAIATGVEA